MDKKRLVYRVLLYTLGLLLLSVGVVISVNSNLGVSPVNSLPYVLSVISGLPMGSWVTGCFLFYILVQVLLLGRDFKWINLTQIVFSTIFGWMVNMLRPLLAFMVTQNYLLRLCMLGVSILFIAAGLALVIDVKLIPMPSEGLALAVAQRFPRIPFHNAKTGLDCAIVCVAVLLSVTLLGGLQGVREGTIISALLIGRTIPLVRKPLQPIMNRVCFCSQAVDER